MEGNDKPSVSFKRFCSILRRRPKPSKGDSGIALDPPPACSTDCLRTRARYIEAARILHEATSKKRHNQWQNFEFPQLNGEPEGFDDPQFRNRLDQVLEKGKPERVDRSMCEMAKNSVRHMCNALSPFAKHFLIIAKEA
jgi:hypothetical protein